MIKNSGMMKIKPFDFQIQKCQFEGHQNFICKRICMKDDCPIELICSECILKEHADHVNHCLDISEIEHKCNEYEKLQNWEVNFSNEITKVENMYSWAQNRFNLIITKIKRKNISELFEQREMRLAVSNISKGNFNEIKSSQIKILKEIFNSNITTFNTRQCDLPNKIQKEHKLLLNFLNQLKQIQDQPEEQQQFQSVQIDEQSNSETPLSKEKISFICSIQISKLRELQQQNKRLQTVKKMKNKKFFEKSSSKLVKLMKMIDNYNIDTEQSPNSQKKQLQMESFKNSVKTRQQMVNIFSQKLNELEKISEKQEDKQSQSLFRSKENEQQNK